MKFKLVPITIIVEVPEDCKIVAINNDGTPYGFCEDSEPFAHDLSWKFRRGFSRWIRVHNWKETLTEVNHER